MYFAIRYLRNKNDEMSRLLEQQAFQILLLDYQADKEKDPKIRVAKSLEAKIKRDRIIEAQIR